MIKRLVLVVLFGMWATTAAAQNGPTPAAQLGAIVHQAEGEGEFDAAIPRYKAFLAAHAGDRDLAADAWFHLGKAYEAVGNLAEARKAFLQVVNRYAAAPAAADAKKHLVTAAPHVPPGAVSQEICTGINCNYVASVDDGGRFMAFIDNERQRQLAVRTIASGAITHFESIKDADWPLLSRDGRRIVYQSSRRENGALGRGKVSLMVIASDPEAKPRPLIANDNDEYRALEPAVWSHDERSVLVQAQKQDETWLLMWVSTNDGSTQAQRSLEWRLRPFLRSGRPALSPDGRFIAYSALAVNPRGVDSGANRSLPSSSAQLVADTTDEHIYVITADFGREFELTHGASIDESPVWTADNKALLFVSNRSGGTFGLWSIAVNQGAAPGEPVQIRPNVGRIVSIGMTRDGAYYYVTPRTYVSAIRIARLESSGAAPLTRPTVNIIGETPTWSPDGSRLAFLRRPDLDTDAGTALVVRSVKSGDERRYVPRPDGGLVPRGKALWLHDGKALLQLFRDGRGEKALYRVDVTTGDFKPVRVDVATDVLVAVSRDDRIAYAIATRRSVADGKAASHLLAINLVSGESRELYTAPNIRSTILSSDGATLFTTECETSAAICHRIVAVDVSGGRQREVLAVAEPQRIATGMTLSGDGRYLLAYVGSWKPVAWHLMRIAADGTGRTAVDDEPDYAPLSICIVRAAGTCVRELYSSGPAGNGNRVPYSGAVLAKGYKVSSTDTLGIAIRRGAQSGSGMSFFDITADRSEIAYTDMVEHLEGLSVLRNVSTLLANPR